MRPRLPSSMTMTPRQPGSNTEAVEWTTIPKRPRLDRPSSRARRLSGRVSDLMVVAKTKSPGCKINGSLSRITTSFIMVVASFGLLGSINGTLLYSNTRNRFPKRRSTEQEPSARARTGFGDMRMRPEIKAFFISLSDNIIPLVYPKRPKGGKTRKKSFSHLHGRHELEVVSVRIGKCRDPLLRRFSRVIRFCNDCGPQRLHPGKFAGDVGRFKIHHEPFGGLIFPEHFFVKINECLGITRKQEHRI